MTRLQSAYAAMLDQFDGQIARLVDFLGASGQLDDTIIVVLSDNGASQEGGGSAQMGQPICKPDDDLGGGEDPL